MISIEQIKAFVAVVEEGSISKAADRLKKTHGPVSLAITVLESKWGELFSDESRRGNLSARGEALYPWAKSLLSYYNEIDSIYATESTPEILIGLDVYLPPSWGVELLQLLAPIASNSDIKFWVGPSDELTERFNAGKLHFIITLIDLPWPNTQKAFVVGSLNFSNAIGASQPISTSLASFNELIGSPQLRYTYFQRTAEPVYFNLIEPNPYTISVSDQHQLHHLLNCLPAYAICEQSNIKKNNLRSLSVEGYGKAEWSAIAYWRDGTQNTTWGKAIYTWLSKVNGHDS